jgi:hypothetical protein
MEIKTSSSSSVSVTLSLLKSKGRRNVLVRRRGLECRDSSFDFWRVEFET